MTSLRPLSIAIALHALFPHSQCIHYFGKVCSNIYSDKADLKVYTCIPYQASKLNNAPFFPQKRLVLEALNQADNEGETPIHRAATIGNVEVLVHGHSIAKPARQFSYAMQIFSCL